MPIARLFARAAPSGVPGARAIVRAGLGRAFGPPPFDPSADPGDPGLHGPDSASWRVIGEPAAIVGGVRGLVVQTLHPLAVAGVAQHSRFRDDALGRLRRTSAYVTTTTFASLPQVRRAARAVRAAHERVRGVAPDGRPYAASDPRLLCWVSIALTESFLAADRAYAPAPVDAATADAFVAEQARGTALLDPRVELDELDDDALRHAPLPLLAEGVLPRTVAELEALRAGFADELAVGPQGREIVAFLRRPDVPGQLLAGYVPLLAGALATMRSDELRMLGLPRLGALAPGVRLQTRALLTALRLASGPSPAVAAARARTRGGAARSWTGSTADGTA